MTMQNYCRLARALNMHNIRIHHIIAIPGTGSLNLIKTLLESDTVTGGIINLFASDSDKHYADMGDLQAFDKKLGKLWNIIFKNDVDKTKKSSKKDSDIVRIKKVYILRDWSSSFTGQEFALLSSLNNWSFVFMDRKFDDQKKTYENILDGSISQDFEEIQILAWDNFHYFKHVCISLHIKFMLVKYDDIDWKKLFSILKMRISYPKDERSTKFKDAVKCGNLKEDSPHLRPVAELMGY